MPDLLTNIDGPIARMTFNRPQVRNALSPSMIAEMETFLRTVAADDKVRCVVMNGAGDHFMAGGDLSRFWLALDQPKDDRSADFRQRAESVIPVFDAIDACRKPIIAQVCGATAGAGLGWVTAADFVIAEENAIFVFAHVAVGLSPDGAVSHFLPRLVGTRRAKVWMLTGARVDAREALSAGLITQLVKPEALDAETQRLARQLSEGPSLALAHTKHLLDESWMRSRSDHMYAEAKAFGECAASDDFLEGVLAFREKRKPAFVG